MFLKVPVKIIMKLGKNNVLCPKYIDIYEFGGYGGMYIFHRTFFVYYSKKRKKYKSMTYTKIKFYIILISNLFTRMNNKKIRKRGSQGALLLFLYEVSIVVLIDFMAILLPPGIFLIKIVNTNNTIMYLNSFS